MIVQKIAQNRLAWLLVYGIIAFCLGFFIGYSNNNTSLEKQNQIIQKLDKLIEIAQNQQPSSTNLQAQKPKEPNINAQKAVSLENKKVRDTSKIKIPKKATATLKKEQIQAACDDKKCDINLSKAAKKAPSNDNDIVIPQIVLLVDKDSKPKNISKKPKNEVAKSKIKQVVTKSIAKRYKRKYTNNGNFMITDDTGGLMWQNEPYTDKEMEAYKADKEYGKALHWKSAIKYCENLKLGGYKEWRLPTLDELLLIVNSNTSNPSIEPIVSNVVSLDYWTSTVVADSTSNAWGVVFSNGAPYWYYKNYSLFVRCVRFAE